MSAKGARQLFSLLRRICFYFPTGFALDTWGFFATRSDRIREIELALRSVYIGVVQMTALRPRKK